MNFISSKLETFPKRLPFGHFDIVGPGGLRRESAIRIAKENYLCCDAKFQSHSDKDWLLFGSTELYREVLA